MPKDIYSPREFGEKVASNAARRLLTRLMRDTANGNIRWHGTNPSVARSILQGQQFRPSGNGDMTFSRHIPFSLYNKGAVLGLTRGDVGSPVRGGGFNPHYSSKHFRANSALGSPAQTPLPNRTLFSVSGNNNPIALTPRSGALRYAFQTNDPDLNTALRNHGARLIPPKLQQHFNDQRIPYSAQLPDRLRQSRLFILPENSATRIVTRQNVLKHLADFGRPAQPTPALQPSLFNRAAAPFINSLRGLTSRVTGFFKRSAAREFGEKVAASLSQYLPDRDTALRQMAVTGLLSSAISGGRSYIDPGYDEKFDEEGRIISRKRRNPTTSALRSAGIGLGMGALSSLASQVGNNWAKDQGFWHPKT